MTEDLPQRPISPYGESKLMFEKILQWYQKIHGLEFIAFRYFNAAGASEKFGEHHRIETHLIPNVLQVVLGQLPAGGDFRHGLSDARRHVHPRLHPHPRPGAGAHPRLAAGRTGFYNLGNGDGYSVREVIKCAKRSRAKKFPSSKNRGGPATRPGWWPRPKKRSTNWAGNPDTQSWKTL
jgi:UDP-glucose 4-epimerase